MFETAAHLADHVFPRLPVRQCALSVPKRLRYHIQHDSAIEALALHIFLSVIEQEWPDKVEVWFRHAFSITLKVQSVCDGIRSAPPGYRPQTLCSKNEDPAERPCFAGFFV
jgi:hypothetical protein